LQNRQRERIFPSFLSRRFYPPRGYGNRRYRTLSPRRREPPGVAAGRYSPRATPTPLPCQGPGIAAPTVGSRHHHGTETEPSPCRAGPCSPGAMETKPRSGRGPPRANRLATAASGPMALSPWCLEPCAFAAAVQGRGCAGRTPFQRVACSGFRASQPPVSSRSDAGGPAARLA
jgi:hypothetical protein